MQRSIGAVTGAWLGSRVLVLLAALAAENLVPRNPRLIPGSDGPLLTSLTSWDGWWYLGVVRDGYHVAPLVDQYRDYAFFPLYPILVRALSLPVPALDGLVAVILSNVLFLVALALLYRLTTLVLDEERALLACVMLCLFPFSFVFSMAYGESLFLALSLGSLLAAERGRPALAAVLAALAGATRLPGVLLVVPLALVLWRRTGSRRALAWLLVVPIGAVLFWGYVTSLTGDPGAYLVAQSAWGRAGAGASSGAGTGGSLASQFDLLHASLFVTLLVYVFLFVFFRPDRIPLPYALVSVLALATVGASGNISSVGRLAMVAFPFIWALAGRRSGAARTGWPALSAGLLGLTSLLVFAGYYQP